MGKITTFWWFWRSRLDHTKNVILIFNRRVVRNSQWGGGLFWKLETTANNLDPDFHQSSTRLSRFFCPNLGELQKKRSSLKLSLFFYPNSGGYYIKFKSKSHQSLTNSRPNLNGGGAIFGFWGQIGLKSAKNRVFCIAPPPSGYATDLPDHDLILKMKIVPTLPRLLWVLMLMQLPALVFSVLVSKDFLCHWYLFMVCKKRVVFSIGCTKSANIL